MFCPQCATPNADGVKFCRSCGLGLEAVALVLSGKPAPPAEAAPDWVQKHTEGVREIVGGVSWLSVSLLIAAALGLFLPSSFDAPWILIWAVLFGWMACVGVIKMGEGVSGVLEAKSRLRLLTAAGREPALAPAARPSLAAAEQTVVTNQPALARPSPPPSVTEGTTRQMGDLLEK